MRKVCTFSERLREMIRKSGRKQAEISESTGIPEGTISRYKNNGRSARADYIELIADYFEKPIAWMMGYDEPLPVKIPALDSMICQAVSEMSDDKKALLLNIASSFIDSDNVKKGMDDNQKIAT